MKTIIVKANPGKSLVLLNSNTQRKGSCEQYTNYIKSKWKINWNSL